MKPKKISKNIIRKAESYNKKVSTPKKLKVDNTKEKKIRKKSRATKKNPKKITSKKKIFVVLTGQKIIIRK